MQLDDIIYIFLLGASIGFGQFYRKQLDEKDVRKKKSIGTAFGLLLILIVSGFHILHTLVSFAICTIIILFVDKKKSHIVSFVFMFSYLLFFRMTTYFGISTPPGHTNLIQMVLTLKMVGLAFEQNTAFNAQSQGESSEQMKKYEKEILSLDPEEILHYAFNYIGVLTGPYFSYRTFRDYFEVKYWQNVKCEKAMLEKLKWVPLIAALFLGASYVWPLSYAMDEDFYEQRSFLYRLMYVWPTFFIFRMRIYIGLILSECVCVMAGLGAYPKDYKSTPGGGPKQIVALEKPVSELEYDFETIHNINASGTEKCWTFREAMRNYNMCVQYWMAVIVYKRFPNKKFRTLITLLVSAFWHGVYMGYYVCMLGAPFYLPIEDLYDKLFRKDATGLKRQIIDCAFWVSKFFAFSYMGIAFLLMTLDKIWYYYMSVFHVGYILWISMYVGGLYLMEQKKRNLKKAESKTN